MKYKEIREALTQKGFIVESIQTDTFVDMPAFTNPNIIGDIYVSFKDNDEDLPEGTYLNYETVENLDDLEIESVLFEIDCSIAFNESVENNIHLYNKDIDNLFYKTLELVTNIDTKLMFNIEYFVETQKFINKVFEFNSMLVKNGFNLHTVKTSGDETTLYTDVQFQYRYKDMKFDYVLFALEVLSWNYVCIVSISGEKHIFNFDVDKSEFESMIKSLIDKLEIKLNLEKEKFNKLLES